MRRKQQKTQKNQEQPSTPLWGKFFLWLVNFYWLLPFAGFCIYWASGRIFYTLALIVPAACAGSFCFYGADKLLAGRMCRRIPEMHLLAWDLLGGWPGGILGQYLFRHKTVKVSYKIRFVLCIVLNCALTFWLIRMLKN